MFEVLGSVFSLFGSMQAAGDRRRAAARTAEQQEFNARLERLRAAQEHNDRIEAFVAYRSTANAIRGVSGRDTNDRSFKARVKAGKDKSIEQLNIASTQSLFAQNRMKFQADQTRLQGAMDANAIMISGLTNFATNMHKISEIS